MTIDSESMGDRARHIGGAELRARFAALAPAPADRGRVVRVVTRREGGRRESPDRIALTIEGGVQGDAWGRRTDRHEQSQVTAMQAGVAAMIADGQPLDLFGDNLFLELDLSATNLPPGSRLHIGGALLEVTPLPHNGCLKFRARFGEDALRFVSSPERQDRRLRGIHLKVVGGGGVGPGDEAAVLLRPPAPGPTGR